MTKRIIVAGFLGVIVIMVWTFMVNGIFRFNVGINMDRIETEREVYALLTEHITEPGRYVFNPEVIPEEGFPPDKPVFSVSYSGLGHGAAGNLMLFGFLLYIASSFMAAWLLSFANERVLDSYVCKVLFYTGIGVLLALFKDLESFNIGDYQFSDALLVSIYDIALWTCVGLVVALIIKPSGSPEPATEI